MTEKIIRSSKRIKEKMAVDPNYNTKTVYDETSSNKDRSISADTHPVRTKTKRLKKNNEETLETYDLENIDVSIFIDTPFYLNHSFRAKKRIFWPSKPLRWPEIRAR